MAGQHTTTQRAMQQGQKGQLTKKIHTSRLALSNRAAYGHHVFDIFAW